MSPFDESNADRKQMMSLVRMNRNVILKVPFTEMLNQGVPVHGLVHVLVRAQPFVLLASRSPWRTFQSFIIARGTSPETSGGRCSPLRVMYALIQKHEPRCLHLLASMEMHVSGKTHGNFSVTHGTHIGKVHQKYPNTSLGPPY